MSVEERRRAAKDEMVESVGKGVVEGMEGAAAARLVVGSVAYALTCERGECVNVPTPHVSSECIRPNH